MPGSSKRLPWWKGLTSGERVFTLISVLFVAGAIGWLAHGPGHVLGTVFFAIAFVIGLVGLLLIPSYMRRVVLESACPCCGAVARRTFDKEGTPFPVPCGSCVAQLRINGHDVVEDSPGDRHGVDDTASATPRRLPRNPSADASRAR